MNPYQPPEASLERDLRAGEAPPGPPALWNPTAIGIWSIVFSAIFGAMLVAANWEALGEKTRARKAFLLMSVSLLPVAINGILSGRVTLAPGWLFTLIVFYVAIHRPQAKYVREKFGKSYPRRRWLDPLITAFVVIIFAWKAFGDRIAIH